MFSYPSGKMSYAFGARRGQGDNGLPVMKKVETNSQAELPVSPEPEGWYRKRAMPLSSKPEIAHSPTCASVCAYNHTLLLPLCLWSNFKSFSCYIRP